MMKMFAALLLAQIVSCDGKSVCVRSHKEISYPNMALVGLGPEWAGVALTPLETEVCDAWQPR